jgi:hypothetical protein
MHMLSLMRKLSLKHSYNYTPSPESGMAVQNHMLIIWRYSELSSTSSKQWHSF